MATTGQGQCRLQVMAKDEDGPDQTFVFHGEDHTLGNALRYIVMKNPEVELCGYTVPHPSENKIHFKIQTHGVSAKEVLEQGLKSLHELCEHIETTFKNSVAEFREEV